MGNGEIMKVELSLHAIGLKNVGGFSGTSDPFAVVTHMATTPGSKPSVLGKTECLRNNLNPEWVKVFVMDYELGTPMKLVVSIFDSNENQNTPMGSTIFDVGEILGVRGQTKAKRLGNSGGTIYAHCRKAQGTGLLRLHLQGQDLVNTEGFMRKSDPFYEISREINAGSSRTWDNVFRSNLVKDDLSPNWESAVMELSVLCGGDLNLPLKIDVFDYENSGHHIIMGSCETSVHGLLQVAGGREPLTLSHKSKSTGQLFVARAEVAGTEEEAAEEKVTPAADAPPPPPVEEEVVLPPSPPSFLDYVSGGCDLNVLVAIDFTGSNGDPRKPGTLHHMDPNSNNPYELAISSIVEILAKYDTDQTFQVVGFGAKYSGVVNHCFTIGSEEGCQGVQGVMDAYHSVFKTGLIMSSPTVFTEVLEAGAAQSTSALSAAQENGKLAYTILLIVSDGAVSDVNATADCLKQIADSPLSVVIVGVGDADFGSMEFLDDLPDVERDLAQFVQFNKHAHKADLTNATLREIPDQLTSYFQSKGIPPGEPIVKGEEEIVVEEEEEEIDLTLNLEEEEIVVSGGGFDTKGAW